MKFNTEDVTNKIANWIKTQSQKANAKGFVLGISGGKDSGVVAGLLCRAVGKENVFGVLMPNGQQSDMDDSVMLCKHLGFDYKIVNISKMYNELVSATEVTAKQALMNIPPRLRMSVLYSIAAEKNYLVCGTGNLSEKYVGYCTKWGDAACDLNPISTLTTEEVIKVGQFLELPEQVILKAPSDGLCGLTDEDNLGFSYEVLNKYIRSGVCEDKNILKIIKQKHKLSQHKFKPITIYKL